MNIYALEGYKVKVTEETKNSGYKSDAEDVARYLTLDKEYTVDYTVVHSSSTEVYLKEVKGKSFNSVNFVGITNQTEEDDMKHAAWKYYNE